MHINNLLLPRNIQQRQSDGCVSCPATPLCDCAANEACFQITKTCNSCGSFKCVTQSSSSPQSGGSSGIDTGAVAGVVVGVIFFFAVVGAYLYRRRRAQRSAAIPEVRDIPAPAESVLNRPDPSEKLTSRPPTELINAINPHSPQLDDAVDIDPESQQSTHGRGLDISDSTQSNPFSDSHSSIQTTGSNGSQGTNVIPIALVQPGSISVSSSTSSPSALETQTLMAPVRPARAPELNLNPDPVIAACKGVPATYAQSQVSGVSSRNSYISNMSYSSEFLKEAPVIVTPTRGVVRQVIGSVKAEMVSAPGSAGLSTPNTPNSLAPPSVTSRPSVRSPLAATSFGPSDILSENEEEHELPTRNDPFSDVHSPVANWQTQSPRSDTASSSPPSGLTPTTESIRHSDLLEPSLPWAQVGDTSRPSSVSTQGESIIVDISNATRVNIGLTELQSGSSTHNAPSGVAQVLQPPYRTTMGRLVTPPSAEALGTLEQQQQRALAHAQARAQAQGGGKNRRVSGSSAISNTADSILESFPFVPPSPISDRPIRSPRSPNQLVSTTTTTQKPLTQPPERPPPPTEALNSPPNRLILGMSTGSQLSTVSTGLGSFPFHIDSDNDPTSANNRDRQRASLDTLALTSDISSYPLAYDRTEQRDSFL